MYFSKFELLTEYPPGSKSLVKPFTASTISDFSNLDRSCGFLLLFAMAGQKIQVFCRSTDLVWRVGEYHIQNTGNWIPVKHCYIRGMAEGSTEGDWKLLHPVEKARWQQYDWAEEESDGWFPDRVRIEYEHFKESEPSPTARHVSVLFCNLEEDRTTAEKEIHFNLTPILSLTNAKLLLVRNPKAENEKSKWNICLQQKLRSGGG